MAESSNRNNNKSLDPFAADLDAMLNDGEQQTSQKVGIIEDDDAIDRLLMAENFPPMEEGIADEPLSDFDVLTADELGVDDLSSRETIDFDDVSTVPEQSGIDVEVDISGFDNIELEDENKLVGSIDDEVFNPQLAALERVEDIDEFADKKNDIADIQEEETETMAEIDEFSEETRVGNNAEFMLTDFDISSGEDLVSATETQSLIDEFAEETELAALLPAEAEQVAGSVSNEQGFMPVEERGRVQETVAERSKSQPDVAVTPPAIDYSQELKALTNQITALKKQQQTLRQELTEKAEKEQLHGCMEHLDTLQTEQKKTKRLVEAVGSKKPIVAYVATGLGVAGLLIGVGMGSQGMIAKSQVGELVAIIGKLQEQVNAAPANDAADKEMLRKQVDELAVSSSVMTNQLAEITKKISSEPGGDNSGASVASGSEPGKQIAELTNQNLQIGASIEALEKKVAALEKSKGNVSVAGIKSEPKKPAPVVEENWAVNLIAFKQDWYARRKAEEYTAKGVQAKVSKTELKGENWYRLSVDGFKTQYEAAGYAARVKKSLNLDSVWVAKAGPAGKE